VDVWWWWRLLCLVSAVNVLAWLVSARRVRDAGPATASAVHQMRRVQLGLSAVYVVGCAYRSIWPVFDVQRLVLFDSWLSSVTVGRSVATVAELCFVLQWALLLRAAAHGHDSRLGRLAAASMLPLIVVAEACSWYAVLSTSNIGHVIEESLWGLSALIFVAGLAALVPRCEPAVRRVLAALCVGGLAYAAYMFLVDVPMYWWRWVADEASGRHYLSVSDGWADASARWIVSHRWSDWQSEVIWMTAYFSVAVWLSVALVHLPAAAVAPRLAARPQAA
jgi:hypothetical protein